MSHSGAVLILSSLVSASQVGGGYQAATLATLGFEAILAPTVLFGRHPGLGPPGGGAVADDLFEGIVTGIAATGAFSSLTACITGYFATKGQAAIAARAIDSIRAVNARAQVVVDPIMGDHETGLYISAETAAAITAELVARADLATPNSWELSRLAGVGVDDPESAVRAARRLGLPVLVSSVPVGDAIGVVFADKRAAWLASHPRSLSAPKGTGDLLTARYLAASLAGAPPAEALERAVAAVAEVVLGAPVQVRFEALA